MQELIDKLKQKGFKVIPLSSGVIVQGDVPLSVSKKGEMYEVRRHSWENPLAVHQRTDSVIATVRTFGTVKR